MVLDGYDTYVVMRAAKEDSRTNPEGRSLTTFWAHELREPRRPREVARQRQFGPQLVEGQTFFPRQLPVCCWAGSFATGYLLVPTRLTMLTVN